MRIRGQPCGSRCKWCRCVDVRLESVSAGSALRSRSTGVVLHSRGALMYARRSNGLRWTGALRLAVNAVVFNGDGRSTQPTPPQPELPKSRSASGFVGHRLRSAQPIALLCCKKLPSPPAPLPKSMGEGSKATAICQLKVRRYSVAKSCPLPRPLSPRAWERGAKRPPSARSRFDANQNKPWARFELAAPCALRWSARVMLP